MSSLSNKGEDGSCIPIVAMKPTFMAYTKDGEIFDYSLTLVKKRFFFGYYSFAELAIKNLVSGEEERDTEAFTADQKKELKSFLRIPKALFEKHDVDILYFKDKEKMTFSKYRGILALWNRKKQ